MREFGVSMEHSIKYRYVPAGTTATHNRLTEELLHVGFWYRVLEDRGHGFA
jgi:hypothetical protein